MSKAGLKKELESMSRGQLVEVVLNAYSSSKQAKAYFEFFLNPDVDALLDKKVDAISRELSRNRRGYSKARVTVIKEAVNSFEAFGVGDEAVMRLICCTIRMMVGMEQHFRCTSTYINFLGKLIYRYLETADRNGCISDALAEMAKIESDGIGRRDFRKIAMGYCSHAAAELASAKK